MFSSKEKQVELSTVNGDFEGSAAVISTDLSIGAMFSRVAFLYLSAGRMFSRVAFSFF